MRPDDGTADGGRADRWARTVWLAAFTTLVAALAGLLTVSPGGALPAVDAETGAPAVAELPGALTAGGGLAMVDADGRLLLRPARGDEAVLAVASPGEEIGGLAGTADGSVYFHRISNGATWCDLRSSVEVVPSGSASSHVIAAGLWPALSPDGNQLSFVQPPTCRASENGASVAEHALVVRNLTTGDERRWTWEHRHALGDDSPGWPTAATWLDGTRLAYGRNFAGGDAGTVWLLDTAGEPGSLGGTEIGPESGRSWWDPSADLSSTAAPLLVLEPGYRDDLGRFTDVRAVTIDGSAGDVVFRSSHDIVSLDVHRTGAILYVERLTGSGLPVLRLRSAGTATASTVATGVAEAVWVG